MAKAPKNAISPTREEDYPEWYQQAVRGADLADNESKGTNQMGRNSINRLGPGGTVIWRSASLERNEK